jgi:hypothetical protein
LCQPELHEKKTPEIEGTAETLTFAKLLWLVNAVGGYGDILIFPMSIPFEFFGLKRQQRRNKLFHRPYTRICTDEWLGNRLPNERDYAILSMMIGEIEFIGSIDMSIEFGYI